MTVHPCVKEKIRKAMEKNEDARDAVKAAVGIIPEGDYRRGTMFYVLKVLNDCQDDYERVLKALEGCE